MRDAYQQRIDGVSEELVVMTGLVGSAIVRASDALLTADLALAQDVIERDADIDELQRLIEESAYELLACQQPVATDLRILVSNMRISTALERMGDLARHIAKVARLRFPEAAVPAELRPTVAAMNDIAVGMAAKLRTVLAHRDVAGALEVERADDKMDLHHRHIFAVLLDAGWSHGVEAAIDVTLVGRYYERFADHAVSIARREVFVVTGERAGRLSPLR